MASLTPPPPPPLPPLKLKIAIASSISALIALGLVFSAYYTLLDIDPHRFVPRPSLVLGDNHELLNSGVVAVLADSRSNARREDEPRLFGDRLMMPNADADDDHHHQQQQQGGGEKRESIGNARSSSASSMDSDRANASSILKTTRPASDQRPGWQNIPRNIPPASAPSSSSSSLGNIPSTSSSSSSGNIPSASAYSSSSSGNIPSASSACNGRYVYIYDLPREFNEELVDKCGRVNGTWDTMCGNLDNNGYGPIFAAGKGEGEAAEGGGGEEGSGILVPEHAWYFTEQFTAEMLFHARLVGSYECITREPEEARLFYVPYYAGMDAALTLFSPRLQVRDRLAQRLAGWLAASPVWTRFGAHRRHFVVLGRTTWDFARSPDFDSGWGTSFSSLPEFAPLTKLLIERNSWRPDELAVPYPTSFHPSSDADVELWQSKVRSSERELLCSFVGSKTRGNQWAKDLRAELSAQCGAAGGLCRQVTCGGNWLPGTIDCTRRPDRLTSLFLNSTFCLQPPGDTPTRKSFFDSLVAGCIPVVFSAASARDQYLWHLPRNASLYSVLLDGEHVIDRKLDVVRALASIANDAPRLRQMQDTVARLIPRLVYALPRNNISNPAFRDAVDVSLDHLLRE